MAEKLARLQFDSVEELGRELDFALGVQASASSPEDSSAANVPDFEVALRWRS